MRRRIMLGMLAVVFVMLLVGIVGTALIRNELLRRSQAEIERQATVTAAIVDQQISTGVREGRPGAFARTLSQLRLLGGHDYLEVAAIAPDSLEALSEGSVLLDEFSRGAEGPIRVDVAGEPVLATYREVNVGSRSWVVAIGRTEPLLVAGLFTRPLVLGLGIGLLVAVGIAAWLSQRIGRRIDRLTEVSASLAHGDFAARAPAEGSDEIAELGRSFNAMADELVASREREKAFLMNVGHDLRTPLTTIRGYVEGLDEGAIAAEDLPRIASVLHQQTTRLTRLVDDLSLLARLEAREFTLLPERVALAAHLREQADAVAPAADAARIRFSAELDDVGSGLVDPDRVGQIVGNLLDNAFRWTPEGGSVTLRLSGGNGVVRIGVSDTGPGIDAADLPHVFDRAYTTPRFQPLRLHGSGLGLAIVRELASAMGGTAAASSKLGEGTDVTVELPWNTPSPGDSLAAGST